MSITALADRRITVYRRSPYVLDPVAVAPALAPSRQPARESCIEITTSGGAAGTVTVSGTVSGLPDSETLVLNAGGDQRATGLVFTSVSGIATAGLAGATVSAQAVGRDGSRNHSVSAVVVTGWPMRMDRGSVRWPSPTFGSSQMEDTVFYLDWSPAWEPREGDVFVDDRTGQQFFVLGPPTQHGGGSTIPHHLEIRVQRREGSVGT
jgi:hypothetical protein